MKYRIRALRESKKLTQKQISEVVGCDKTLYSRYETSNRVVPLHIMMKLAVYYNTSIDYLACLTDEDEPYPRRKKHSRN